MDNKKLHEFIVRPILTNLHNFFTCIRMSLYGTCILYISGHGDNRNYCKPDAVFIKGRYGAIVEMKNYEGTPLGRSQIDMTYNDMCALKDSMGCRQVSQTLFIF